MSSESEALFDLGRAAWPRLDLEPTAFERRLGDLETKGTPPRIEHAADLYLACACAEKVRGAAEAFEASFTEPMLQAIRRIDGSPEFAQEALQLLRIKLFVMDPPKIGSYGGRAKLTTWLATTAARAALNLRESSRRPAHDPLEGEPAASLVDPELDYVRDRYRAEFQRAVNVAVAQLSSRERTLLRLHLGERLGIDRLAVVYGTGRSTVARWLAAARAKLFDGARREAQARLGVSPSELLEVGADLRSAIDVSLIRLLGSGGD